MPEETADNESAEQDKKDSPADGKPAASTSGGATQDRDTLKSLIREILAEERSTTDAAAPKRIDIEAEAERLVQAATEKLVADREAADNAKKKAKEEAAKLKETVEQAPAHLRKVTKFMWGSE